MGRIPDSFIETVLAQTDIVSLIQESISLKKTGANYSACCPFHAEKTPSFTVSAQKQFYHCFGCQAHGNSISFVMEYQQLNFLDALEVLSSRLGLTVPREKNPEVDDKKNHLGQLLTQVNDYYKLQLKKHSLRQPAVDYLKKRGVTGKTALTFELGFAPIGWQNLTNHFPPETIPLLEELGLIIKHESGRHYDRFRNRIMFPVRDRKGQVLGFGARALSAEDKPKYLNSSESPMFKKGHCCYGIFESFKLNPKLSKLIVVEGYLDVITLTQNEIPGVIATQGTAITSDHLNSIFQCVDEIIFCFDGDKAGRQAAWKALIQSLPLLTNARQIKFVFLPSNTDPDSYIQKYGKDKFKEMLNQSVSLTDYLLTTLSFQFPPSSYDNKARFIDAARPLILQIPSPTLKEILFEELSKLVKSSDSVVRGNRFKSNYQQKAKTTQPPQPQFAAYMAAALLIRSPERYPQISAIIKLFKEVQLPGLALLKIMVNLLEVNPKLDKKSLYDEIQSQGAQIQPLIECNARLDLLPPEALTDEFDGICERLKQMAREGALNVLLDRAKLNLLTVPEQQELQTLLQNGESNP